MVIFYFLFFIFFNSLSSMIAFNLKDIKFNLLNEFFFCLDSFSTTFVIFYLVLFFLAYDIFLEKSFNIKPIRGSSFFYLKIRFITLIFKNFIFISLTSLIKWLKLNLIINFNSLKKTSESLFFLKKTMIWRPLFKRWSYFGLWSKKNNK